MPNITVFKAKSILTMDRNQPEATHVAVMDGKILAVGGSDCADQWGRATLDSRFENAVLMPGFVEGHAHMMAGAMWEHAYAGYHDRYDDKGHLHKGMTDISQVIANLKKREAELADGQPLFAWGFDPIFLTTERLNRHHLDQISKDRPIGVLYSNFHVMCVNSAALALAGYDENTPLEGVVKGEDGKPTGELQEMAAKFPILRRMNIDFRTLAQKSSSIWAYANVARRAGVTTITDLFSTMEDEDLEEMLRITDQADFPLRIVPATGINGGDPAEIAARAKEMRTRSTDKLRLGAVKLMTDGSIQGWTARVKWPGYVGGKSNGIWNTAPDQIFELCETLHREGIQMHIHVNGDEASDVVLHALEAAARAAPWPAHRHVLQHGQMMGEDQFRRCAELGVNVNLFVNHIWYFGDQHASLTVGKDRAARMNACRSALDAGINLAMHSDAPVTPLGPLFTAWCAVNRITPSGEVLGEAQRITVEEALRAITLGAAHTLKLDGEIGSIEPGKKADFVVLDQHPLEVDPIALKDVGILGTVFDGMVHLS